MAVRRIPYEFYEDNASANTEYAFDIHKVNVVGDSDDRADISPNCLKIQVTYVDRESNVGILTAELELVVGVIEDGGSNYIDVFPPSPNPNEYPIITIDDIAFYSVLIHPDDAKYFNFFNIIIDSWTDDIIRIKINTPDYGGILMVKVINRYYL